MKADLRFILCLDLTFVLLLILSGSLTGVVSELIYYAAFALPLLLYFFLADRGGEKGAHISLKPNRRSFMLIGGFCAPIVEAVFVISALTTLLLTSLGLENGVEGIERITFPLLLSALLPAVLEELLFRYVPLSILEKRSPVYAISVSAVLFALVHLNLFQLPYALFAGAAFALLDLAAGSIWPSLIIHLVNNTASLIWMRCAADSPSPFLITLGACTVLSLVFAAVFHRQIRSGK